MVKTYIFKFQIPNYADTQHFWGEENAYQVSSQHHTSLVGSAFLTSSSSKSPSLKYQDASMRMLDYGTRVEVSFIVLPQPAISSHQLSIMKSSLPFSLTSQMILAILTLCFLMSIQAVQVSTIPTAISLSSFERGAFRSIMYLKAPQHDMDCICSNVIASKIDSLSNFDNSFKIEQSKVEASISTILEKVLPSTLLHIESLRNDATDMIMTISALSLPAETITCRLALINGVRCPKWHEDYVKIRLLKTYYGIGTEWVDPDDMGVRAMNHLRSAMDWDLDVKDRRKIKRANVNDVLIISGRVREDSLITPVLHRSPPVIESSRRLLFTVTIS